MRAEHETGAGNVQQGPAQAPVQGPEPRRLAESCQPSRCVYPKRISGTPGTHRSYERALLNRIVFRVPHNIAPTQHASLNPSDKIGNVKSNLLKSDLHVYAI
jgi:hypothetical protein